MDKQQIMTLVACSVGAGLLLEFIKRLIEEVNQGPNKITAVGVIKLMISILQGAIAGAAIAFAPVYLWCSEPQSKSSGRLADDAIRILGGTGEYMPAEKGWQLIGCGAILGSLWVLYEWNKKHETSKQ